VVNTNNFVKRELKMLGRLDVFEIEHRRHLLLGSGFIPPEDIQPYSIPTPPSFMQNLVVKFKRFFLGN
jgi:hypothetical protein